MIAYTAELDMIFAALADPTRRDILARLVRAELTVGEIAKAYLLSFAAVSKHLKVLERAGLVSKRRMGRERYVCLAPEGMQQAVAYVRPYETYWAMAETGRVMAQ
jgi:DNA-binding transcriptional ArsR family regulator